MIITAGAKASQLVNRAAEESVLGAILLADNALEPLLVEVGLRASHFSDERLRVVFEAMTVMGDAGRSIDVLTVCDQLALVGALDMVGGAVAVDAFAGAAPAAGNVQDYARIVVELASWRARHDAARAMLAAVELRDEAAFGTAEAAIADGDRPEASTSTADELAEDVFDYLGQTGPPDCLPTPFDELNRLLAGGFYDGDTTALSAWTSHGKSATMHGFLEHGADLARDGKLAARGGFHIYSNEMSKRDYTLRAVSSYSGVPFSKLKARDLTDAERARAMRGLERFAALGIGITDCAGWSAHDIARHLRRHRWRAAGIDLLNLIPHRGTEDFDEISLTLNNAARQSGAHLFLLCQLNNARNVGDTPPRPVKRDIRGSSQIAADAANVLFVHRQMEEMTLAGSGATAGFKLSQDGEMFLDKARNGELGGLDVTLDPRRIRFIETPRAYA